jgi:hypothetical protein
MLQKQGDPELPRIEGPATLAGVSLVIIAKVGGTAVEALKERTHQINFLTRLRRNFEARKIGYRI